MAVSGVAHLLHRTCHQPFVVRRSSQIYQCGSLRQRQSAVVGNVRPPAMMGNDLSQCALQIHWNIL
eukprot:2530494-Amphidinium_carterae.3